MTMMWLKRCTSYSCRIMLKTTTLCSDLIIRKNSSGGPCCHLMAIHDGLLACAAALDRSYMAASQAFQWRWSLMVVRSCVLRSTSSAYTRASEPSVSLLSSSRRSHVVSIDAISGRPFTLQEPWFRRLLPVLPTGIVALIRRNSSMCSSHQSPRTLACPATSSNTIYLRLKRVAFLIWDLWLRQMYPRSLPCLMSISLHDVFTSTLIKRRWSTSSYLGRT